jgi:hypothetical protein
VALGQVFSEYYGFPCQFSFHRLLHIHHHLSSGPGSIGQTVADVPTGLSLTPPPTTVVMKSCIFWVMTLFSRLKVNQHFGGICRLHLQDRRIIHCKKSVWSRLQIERRNTAPPQSNFPLPMHVTAEVSSKKKKKPRPSQHIPLHHS